MTINFDEICRDCGARLGEHMIGGPYHPKPLNPAAAKRQADWDAYVADCQIYNRQEAFYRALDRARNEK